MYKNNYIFMYVCKKLKITIDSNLQKYVKKVNKNSINQI